MMPDFYWPGVLRGFAQCAATILIYRHLGPDWALGGIAYLVSVHAERSRAYQNIMLSK